MEAEEKENFFFTLKPRPSAQEHDPQTASLLNPVLKLTRDGAGPAGVLGYGKKQI